MKSKLIGASRLPALAFMACLYRSPAAKADTLHELAVSQQIKVDGATRDTQAAQAAKDDAFKGAQQSKNELLSKRAEACSKEGTSCRDDAGWRAFLEWATSAEETASPINLGSDQKPEDVLSLCGVAASPNESDAATPNTWTNTCKGLLKTIVEKRDAFVKASKTLESQVFLLNQRKEELKKTVDLVASATDLVPGSGLGQRLKGVRRVRCMTAYCWGGDGSKYGIEPLLDLPIGLSWAIGNGSLANYINANRIDVAVSAGIRFWFADDIASLGLVLARPSLTSTGKVYLEFSDKTFGPSAVSRSFPTLVLGLWGDIFSISVSYDQLRNTDGSGPVDPRFRHNEVLSRAIVFGVSINTLTAARNAIGAAGGDSK